MTSIFKGSAAARFALFSLATTISGVAHGAAVGQYALGSCVIDGQSIAVTVSAVRLSDGYEVKGFTLVDVASGKKASTTKFEDQGAVVRTYVADAQGAQTYDLQTDITIVSETEMKLPGLVEPISRIEMVKSPGSNAAFGTYSFSLSLGYNSTCQADAANIAIILD